MAKATIVAVDDSRTIRRAIEITFAKQDFELHLAASGQEGLGLVRRVRPDIVLADHRMPAPDGYELCRAIKADPSLAGTKVVILCSQKHPFDRQRGAQADAFLIKPFETQTLIDLATALAEQARKERVEAAVPEPTPAAPSAAEVPTGLGRAEEDLEEEIEILIEDEPEEETAERADATEAPSARPERLELKRTQLYGSGLGRPAAPPAAQRAEPPLPPAHAVSLTPPPTALPKEQEVALKPVKPAVGRPAEGKPAEVKAAEAKPGAPVFGRPAEAKRAEVKAAEAKPAAAAGAEPAGRAASPDLLAGEKSSDMAAAAVQRVVAEAAAKGPEYEAIAKLSVEVIERIAWEVVPELAEVIVKEVLAKKGLPK